MLQVEGITTKEVAKRLDLTTQRVRQLMNEGHFNVAWTPLGRLVDPDSVEVFRQQREASSATSWRRRATPK